ncbi:hypothetical protein NP493_1666g00017, partial [Ridgeia piscesae]
LDTCRSQPCQNGGSCRSLRDAFQCACVSNFTGDFCEIDTNTCRSNPCLNGGTCRDWFNGYLCQYSDSFSGDGCEKPVGILLIGFIIGIIVGVVVSRCRRQPPVDEVVLYFELRVISARRTEQCPTEEKVEKAADYEGLAHGADTAEVDFAAQQSKSSFYGLSIT